MSDNYYGVAIHSFLEGDRWKWRITLPEGVSMTATTAYSTAEQAVVAGRTWWCHESACNAINMCLLELNRLGAISHREYSNFMQSCTQLIQQI